MEDLKGKVGFVTGGGSGVGLGQAKVFAREGMKIVIADIRDDHLDEAMDYFKKEGREVHPIKLDITDREAYVRAAEETEKVFGPVDVLFNTAGISIFGPMQDATYDDWEWTLNVNLYGVINGIQTFVPRMIARGEGGHIVNTASMSAFVSLPGTGLYTTSKMAVRGLTECLRMDLEAHNIGVSVLCPGAVNSNIHEAVLTRPKELSETGYYGADPEMMKRLKQVIEPGMEPETLAEHVLKGVKNNDLYILPYPEFHDALENIHKSVMESLAKPEDDPDYERRIQNRAPGVRQRQQG